MSGGQFMVVMIVAIVMVASIIKSRYRAQGGTAGHVGGETAETHRLREEVKQLKERLAVLERITVEKESSLEREIERLRNS
jgi:cell shape-determining protein MreC